MSTFFKKLNKIAVYSWDACADTQNKFVISYIFENIDV